MLRAIRYELNPTKKQMESIRRTCGCCRLVYNTMLSRKISAYEKDGTKLSDYDLIKELVNLKSEKEFLKETPSHALQQAILNMGKAFSNFFKNRKSGFPKFRKKGGKDSYRIPVPCCVDYDKWMVKIAKTGWVKVYKGHNKQIDGAVKSYTITHTPTDRYFISILYEAPDKERKNNNTHIGIDVGIKDFAVLSDGTVFENQKHLKSSLRKLRVLQRTVSRRYRKGKKKEEQSNNWKKAERQVARLHERIAFQRKDYIDKVSTWIAEHYSTVSVETLNVKGMLKNRKLARSISDAGWGMFIAMLEYKCDRLVKIDRFFASSQMCGECGYKNEEVKDLKVRRWICPRCGAEHDRDLNAARNIDREGLSLCGHNVGGGAERVPGTPLL